MPTTKSRTVILGSSQTTFCPLPEATCAHQEMDIHKTLLDVTGASRGHTNSDKELQCNAFYFALPRSLSLLDWEVLIIGRSLSTLYPPTLFAQLLIFLPPLMSAVPSPLETLLAFCPYPSRVLDCSLKPARFEQLAILAWISEMLLYVVTVEGPQFSAHPFVSAVRARKIPVDEVPDPVSQLSFNRRSRLGAVSRHWTWWRLSRWCFGSRS